MSNLDSTAAAAERGMAERESTPASVSAMNGAPKCKKRKMKKKNKMQEQQESKPDLDSTAAAEVGEQGEAKGRGMEELEATDAAASGISLDGAPKCKKKRMKKKNKIQEQQESLPDLDSTLAAEAEQQGETKGRGMEEGEATDAAASALNGTLKCKKKKMKKKNKIQEQQESLPDLDCTVAAEAEQQGETKGRGMEGEATDAAASALNGMLKCKKKMKKKNNMQEQQQSPPDLDSMVATEAEEQGEAKERGMEELEVTDAAASPLNSTPKCKKKKKVKKKNKMQEDEKSTPDLDSTVAPEAEEQGEAKGKGMEEPEAIDAAASAMEGTPKCNKEEAKVEDSVMLEKEVTATVFSVSASEGTPKRKKRKRKNKMQEQLEPPQALSVIVGVDKVMSNKSENGCADGVEESGHADVSMDPINGDDPSCAQSNVNDPDVLVENCSKNLQESSAGRKRRKKKRRQGSSSRWPGFSSENGGMVAMHSLDSSTHHDLSCICASCLAHQENIKNIYSPRGSLVRFQRKKLLILDLNGLLADINQDFHNAHKAHAKVRGKLVFRRPYYDDFLRFCFQNFELGIWSSRKRENVNSVVDILMRDLKQYLLFCWDMSYCTVTGCNTIDNKHKPLVLKELKKLWNKDEPNLPWEQGEFSPSNTLLVDDSPYKALCNPPNTAIFPQPYSYRNQKDDYSLGPDGDLRIYLERVAAADNVQNFVRDNPFGQNSIMESDPNWNFYVKIVDKVEKKIVDQAEKKIVDKAEKQIVDKVIGP